MKRQLWSSADLALLREHYPDSRTDDLAFALRRPVDSVYWKAADLGLHKSAAYLESDNACRIQRGLQNEAMKAAQFKPGHVPANKGLRRPGWTAGEMARTQFKPGRPATEARNYVPIGTLRINADGCLERKVTDDPSLAPARRRVGVHRLVWEAAHGPVADGHAVVFRPGRRTADPEAITLDALELVTRAELMRRNSVHTKYPPEVARLVQLNGALKRQINKRVRDEHQDDQRPA